MQEDWEAEFAKYKASPEYQKVNRYISITLHNAYVQTLPGMIHTDNCYFLGLLWELTACMQSSSIFTAFTLSHVFQ